MRNLHLLSYVVPVKSKVKISQNYVAFSEYMNFKMLFIRKSRVRLVKQIQVDNSVCFQSIAGSSKYRKLCQYTSRRMYRILPRSSKRWSELQLKRPLSMLLYPSSWRFCHIEVLYFWLHKPFTVTDWVQLFGYLAN